MIKPPSQAPFAPVPKGLVQLFAFRFSLSAFRFQLLAFLLPFRPPTPPHSSFFILHCAFPHSALTALASRKAVPPSGSRYRVIYYLSIRPDQTFDGTLLPQSRAALRVTLSRDLPRAILGA
jgi:hypothetical protein